MEILREMLDILGQIEVKESAIRMNDKYLKRPKEGKFFFSISISDAETENRQLRKEIDLLTSEYEGILKELIINEADFDMIYELFSDEIDNEGAK